MFPELGKFELCLSTKQKCQANSLGKRINVVRYLLSLSKKGEGKKKRRSLEKGFD